MLKLLRKGSNAAIADGKSEWCIERSTWVVAKILAGYKATGFFKLGLFLHTFIGLSLALSITSKAS